MRCGNYYGKVCPGVPDDILPRAVQKWLNRSIYRLVCGLVWAEGSTISIIFPRLRQCALSRGHIDATWRIRLNRPYVMAMRPYVKLPRPRATILQFWQGHPRFGPELCQPASETVSAVDTASRIDNAREHPICVLANIDQSLVMHATRCHPDDRQHMQPFLHVHDCVHPFGTLTSDRLPSIVLSCA